MWLTEIALCVSFILPINKNFTWLKQCLDSNKNQPLLVFLLESMLIQKFPPDKGFNITETKLHFMIGKFFAPQLPPSLVEWGSKMHFGPVFMSNHCHQNNGAYYMKILCK